MVSLNTYGVTQPAFTGLDPAEDGFTYDVTSWLHDGCNTLTVVLIGEAGETPFRMTVTQDGQPDWTLDEANFLAIGTPWRLWTKSIEREAPKVNIAAGEPASEAVQIIVGGASPGPRGLGRFLRVDHSIAPPSFISMATPDHPLSAASV